MSLFHNHNYMHSRITFHFTTIVLMSSSSSSFHKFSIHSVILLLLFTEWCISLCVYVCVSICCGICVYILGCQYCCCHIIFFNRKKKRLKGISLCVCVRLVFCFSISLYDKHLDSFFFVKDNNMVLIGHLLVI